MAALLTAAYMRARWPGVFSDAPTPPALDPLDEALIAAATQLSVDNWSSNYNEAVVLLAGHYAILGSVQRAGGAQKYKAGFVEIDYGVGGVGKEMSTSFLALYKALLSRQVRMRVPDGF